MRSQYTDRSLVSKDHKIGQDMTRDIQPQEGGDSAEKKDGRDNFFTSLDSWCRRQEMQSCVYRKTLSSEDCRR